MIGPLLELRRALLVPVERRGRLRGVLLAGSRQKRGDIPIELFESAAAELALAVELHEEQHLSAGRLADLRTVKQLLADLSATRQPDQILADLVGSCTASHGSRDGLGATFAAAGCLREGRGIEGCGINGAVPAVDFLWKSGEQVWINNLENSPFADVWRQAIAERRLTSRDSETHINSDGAARAFARTFIHFVAIPLESDGKLSGVLVAGLPSDVASPATLERLELRGALAATALASWKRNNEEIRLAAWRKSLLDNGAQATVLLDEDGCITAMSAAACRLLGEQPGENPRELSPENRRSARCPGRS